MSDQHTHPCALCGAAGTRPHLRKFGLQMRRCPRCGLVFTAPQPAREVVLARYSPTWFEHEYLPSYGIDPQRPTLDHLAPRYAAELAPLAPFRRTGRLLDVGAGAGLFLAMARDAGWQVFGVEIAPFGPDYARRHFGIDIITGTLAQAAFPSGYFDAVVLQDTIEHVDQPFELLREIDRVLRPGGVAVISTPNYNSLGRRIAGEHWALISPAEHLYLFGAGTLRMALRAAGLQVRRLASSADITPALVHQTAGRHAALTRRLEQLRKALPRWLVARLGLGDELHAIATAPERRAA